MRFTPNVFLLLIAVCCLGCATPYQSTGLMGGFSETQLSPDVFRVTFAGNAYTSGDRAQDFAMLRAAELAEQNGFKYFAVINEEASTAVSTYTTPGTAQTTGSAYIYGGPRNYYGNYSGQTTYTPPQTHFLFKPRNGLLVQCFKQKPDGIYAFDVAFLKESIKGKYKIN